MEMASRHNTVGVTKQKMAVAEHGGGRPALGDIGNLQLDGKPLPQKEAADNNKKAMAVNIDSNKGKKTGSSSSRNKKPRSSLTSTLTARGKALNYELKQANIVDIDALDVNNQLAAVEYVDDIYKFFKLVENESKVHDYMHSQPEINDKMRAILIDWLIEVHNKFKLANETLYLTINIVDRFLAAETVARRELQCVGMSAMLIASKYEEIRAPKVNDLVLISAGAYEHRHVLVMEWRILRRLKWMLTVPTPYVFLTRFIKAAAAAMPPDETNMVYFYAELGMMNYETIRYCPSMIGAAAVYAARSTLNKSPVWHETLQMHTGFAETHVMECAKLLVTFHLIANTDEKRKAIYEKYSCVSRGAVALYPPAKSLSAAPTPFNRTDTPTIQIISLTEI